MCKRRKRGRKKKKCFIPCCSSVEESDGEDSYGADPRPTKIGSVLVSSDSPSLCDRVVLLMNRTFKRGNRNIITVREQTDPSRRIVFTPPPRDFALPGQCFQEEKEAPQRIVETPKPRPVLITPKRTLVSHQVECFDEEPEEPQKTGNVQKEEEEEEIPNIAHVKSIAKARRKKKKKMEENKEMDSYDTEKENQVRAFPHKSEPLVLEDLDNIDKEESIPEHKELMETKPTPVDEEDMGPPLSSSTTFIGGDDKEEEDLGPLLSSSTTFISPADGNKGFICNENPAVNKKVVKQNAVIAVQPTESANSFRLSDGDDKRSKARKEDKKSKIPQPPRIIKVKPVNKAGKSDFKEAEQDKKPEEKENATIIKVSPTRPVTPMRFRMRRPSWSGWG